MEDNLKINCTEEEVMLMPVKDMSTSRAWLVDRGYHSFVSKKTGQVLKTTDEQRVSAQVWRIPQEKSSINTLEERTEEVTGVYAKEDCSIPAVMGKYIPVQTNCEITGEVLIKISDKTITGLVPPEFVFNKKNRLGCIFGENHTLELMLLKRAQTVGLVTSCVVMQ